MVNNEKKPAQSDAADNEPSLMFEARKKLRNHFLQKRNELTAGAKGLLALFARQKINGTIGSIENDAMSEVENGNFQNVDAVLAKADKRIEEETRDFRDKLELFKPKEKKGKEDTAKPRW